MKKYLVTILLFYCSLVPCSAQFGWVRIYDADTCGIMNFKYLKYNNNPLKDIYIQFGMSQPPIHSTTALYYTWSRLNKNTNSWYVLSHNSFLHSNPFYCYWPINMPGWRYYRVADFLISSMDTNLILEVRDVPPCNPGIQEPIQDTRITFNNGVRTTNLPQFYNDALGNLCGGFDFDPLNDAVMYFAYPAFNFNTRCVWKSTNRGTNWFATDTVNFNSNGMLKVNPMRRTDIFLSYTSLYKSTSSGYDFFPVASVYFRKITFDLTDSSIYGITQYTGAGIYKSTNLGNNWFLLRAGLFLDIEISPDNHNIVYAGSDSGLYRSSNAGVSWQLYNNSFTPSNRVIGISKDAGTGDTLYVATYKAVYKVWGSWVGITPVSNEIPSQFRLYQNYPNPFNPVTRIKFDVPSNVKREKSNVKVVIYDVLGKDVATLVNEQLKPGTYEVEWNATHHPSGVYFYTLRTGDASTPLGAKDATSSMTMTKKMVLLK
jgi:type IX secretion system substrate protein